MHQHLAQPNAEAALNPPPDQSRTPSTTQSPAAMRHGRTRSGLPKTTGRGALWRRATCQVHEHKLFRCDGLWPVACVGKRTEVPKPRRDGGGLLGSLHVRLAVKIVINADGDVFHGWGMFSQFHSLGKWREKHCSPLPSSGNSPVVMTPTLHRALARWGSLTVSFKTKVEDLWPSQAKCRILAIPVTGYFLMLHHPLIA